MTDSPYPPPLNQLLSLGDTGDLRDSDAWPDYLALGLGLEHVPDLIRIATDPDLNDGPSDSAEVWALVHAWRTLALLHAAEAVAPLTRLFRRVDEDDDDAVGEDLPEAFGVLGPAAVPALTHYLLDQAHGMWARIAAAHSLAAIGGRHAEARLACIDALTQALARYADEDPSFNGFVISFLIELKAVEARAVMEQAFAAEAVEDGIAGDWEAVQIALGLKDHRDRPRLLTAQQRRLQVMLADFERASQPPVRPLTTTAEFEARAARALAAKQPGVTAKSKRKRHRKRR